MNKKSFVVITCILVIIVTCILGYQYYEHNYVELVTDYYRMTYTLPIVKTDLYGKQDLTDQKVSFERMPAFKNDSTAIVYIRKDLVRTRSFYQKTYNQLLKEHPQKEMEKITYMAKKEAVSEKLQEFDGSQYTVIAFSHPRQYDSEEFLKAMKESGLDLDRLTKFCEDHHLKAEYYHIDL